jgi:hypothetical protein
MVCPIRNGVKNSCREGYLSKNGGIKKEKRVVKEMASRQTSDGCGPVGNGKKHVFVDFSGIL